MADSKRVAEKAVEMLVLRDAVESLEQELLERGGETKLLNAQLQYISGLVDKLNKRAP